MTHVVKQIEFFQCASYHFRAEKLIVTPLTLAFVSWTYSAVTDILVRYGLLPWCWMTVHNTFFLRNIRQWNQLGNPRGLKCSSHLDWLCSTIKIQHDTLSCCTEYYSESSFQSHLKYRYYSFTPEWSVAVWCFCWSTWTGECSPSITAA